MKYPYIGSAGGVNALFTHADSGFDFDDQQYYENGFNEYQFKNTTFEYLKECSVEIKTPEHGEFVQKLAFNAGYKWNAGETSVISGLVGKYINFKNRGCMTYSSARTTYGKINIPLSMLKWHDSSATERQIVEFL